MKIQQSHKYNKRAKHTEPLLRAIVCLIFSLFLSSCSNDPSETDGRKLSENKFGSLAKIISFKETNAQEANYGGLKLYIMEYSAEIEYLHDATVNTWPGGEFSIRKGLERYRFATTQKQRGTKETREGSLYFEQTKNGWREKQ